VRKAAPVTSLFLSYMEPPFYVSRGRIGEADSGKRDYRHRARTECVRGRLHKGALTPPMCRDKFKKLLLRFEHLQCRHYGMKLMAYALINVR